MGEGLEGQPGLRGAPPEREGNAGLWEQERKTLVSACPGKVSRLGPVLAPRREGKGIEDTTRAGP